MVTQLQDVAEEDRNISDFFCLETGQGSPRCSSNYKLLWKECLQHSGQDKLHFSTATMEHKN